MNAMEQDFCMTTKANCPTCNDRGWVCAWFGVNFRLCRRKKKDCGYESCPGYIKCPRCDEEVQQMSKRKPKKEVEYKPPKCMTCNDHGWGCFNPAAFALCSSFSAPCAMLSSNPPEKCKSCKSFVKCPKCECVPLTKESP